MPDLSMCNSQICPDRLLCYRFTAIPSQPTQSYACFFIQTGGICSFYICNKGKQNRQIKDCK